MAQEEKTNEVDVLSRFARAVALIAEFRERQGDLGSENRESLLSQHPEMRDALEFAFDVWFRPNAPPPETTIDGMSPPCPESNDNKTTELRPGQWFGSYRILRRLGEGGMGIVWLAEQPTLDRLVALKQMDPMRIRNASDQGVRRFHREAKAASRLEHPNVCPVYEMGETDGIPFIAMRCIHGRSLAEHIDLATTAHVPPQPDVLWSELAALSAPDGEPLSDAARVESHLKDHELTNVLHIMEQTAHAVQAAHEAGIVHRDLKPANILIQRDGTPIVLDFGLATDAYDEGAPLTESGMVLGTPPYMAPEQLEGRIEDIDHRTDVYALGVILYEVLTLQQPHSGATLSALLRDVLRGEPIPPNKRNLAIPRDLAAVCLHAMNNEKPRRYASAVEFADDLRNVRMLAPVLAKKPSVLHVLARRCRRNPAAAWFLGISFTMGVLVLVLVLTLRETDEERSRNAVIRGNFQVAFASVRESLGRGEEPPASDWQLVRAHIPPDLVELFVEDPRSLKALRRVTEFVQKEYRSSELDEGVHLVSPRGTITKTNPVFRLQVADSERHAIFQVTIFGANGQHWVLPMIDQAGRSEITFKLPLDMELSPGAWRWELGLDPKKYSDADEPLAGVNFEVSAEDTPKDLLAALSPTGDAVLDRHLDAATLLREGFATFALPPLVREFESLDRIEDRARNLLLRIQAHEILAQDDEARKLRRQLAEIQPSIR